MNMLPGADLLTKLIDRRYLKRRRMIEQEAS